MDAYRSDLEWFGRHIARTTVGSVKRADLIRLLGNGPEQGLAQSSINRRVMVGMMALRNAVRSSGSVRATGRSCEPFPSRSHHSTR